MMRRLANVLAVCLLFVTAPALAIEPAVKMGVEFQVNTYTPGSQRAGSIAVAAAGSFVITWIDDTLDGSLTGIFAQRYQSDGTPAGTAFQVNSYTVGFQGAYTRTDIAASADGSFVVVWDSYQDGSFGGVFAQRFDDGGVAVGTEFQANSFTTDHQFAPRVALDAAGNFVVVWVSSGQDGSSDGVFGQRYDSAGAPVGTEFQVNSYTFGFQGGSSNQAVASDAAGNFVVVWTDSSGLDGSDRSVQGQRFDSTGAALGTEFLVNSYTLNFQGLPSVASDAEGDFVVTWVSFQDGSSASTHAQRYDSTGNATGSEFQVNSYTIGIQVPIHRSVFADSDGDFVIVWRSDFQDGGYSSGTFGQQFDSSGTPVGSEFQINSYTTGYQRKPAIAGNDQGFVVTWFSDGQDGSNYGAFAQRFEIPAASTPTITPTVTDTPEDTPTVTPTVTSTPIGDCPASVDGGCTTGFAKGMLLVKEDIAGKERLVAKMVKGPALAQTVLGNPLDPGGTVYSLCVYDDADNLAGGVYSSVVVDRAGDDCGGVPCWKPVGADPPGGKGYKYKDAALAADGVSKLLYKGGDLGKSKAIVKGNGPNLPDGIPAALQTTTFATVQLRSSDGICLSVVVDDVKKHSGAFFKAKFSVP